MNSYKNALRLLGAMFLFVIVASALGGGLLNSAVASGSIKEQNNIIALVALAWCVAEAISIVISNGGGSLILWLLLKGVNVQRWQEQVQQLRQRELNQFRLGANS